MKFSSASTSTSIVGLLWAMTLVGPAMALSVDSEGAEELTSRNDPDSFIDYPREMDDAYLEELVERDPILWGAAAKVGWKVGSRLYGAWSSRRHKRDLEDFDDLEGRDTVADEKMMAARRAPWAFQLTERELRELEELEERDPLLWGLAAQVGWSVGKRVYQRIKSRKGKREYLEDELDARSEMDMDLEERDILHELMDEFEAREYGLEDWEDVTERDCGPFCDSLEEMD